MIKIEVDEAALEDVISKIQGLMEKLDCFKILSQAEPSVLKKIDKFLDQNFTELQSEFRGVQTSITRIAEKERRVGTPVEVGMGMKREVVSADPLEMTQYLRESLQTFGVTGPSITTTANLGDSAITDISLNKFAFRNFYPSRLEEYLESKGLYGFMYLSDEQQFEITEIMLRFIDKNIERIMNS